MTMALTMALPLARPAHGVLFSATQCCIMSKIFRSQRLPCSLRGSLKPVECMRPTPTVLRMCSSQAATLRVSENGGKLTVAWQSDRHESTYHSLWLRHNCRCPECVEASSGQKLVLPERDLQQGVKIESATIAVSGDLQLSWSCGHSGHISLQKLRENCYSPHTQQKRHQETIPLTADSIPRLSATELDNDRRLWEWLRDLNVYGLCLLTGIPPKLGEIKKVAEKITHVQTTIYGETFQVVAMKNPMNVAYTTLPLDVHVDLVYYESPPGLQLLHCIRNDPCVQGGRSILLDAFPVLEEMRRCFPTHFSTLVRVPATFQKIHYNRPEPVEMKYQRPHVVVDTKGKITGINWAPLFEGPLYVEEEDVEPYYEAYTCLANMIEKSNLKLFHLLKPGEAITFNNRRILHGRTSIELNGGVRHLEGVYLNIDEFKSKFQVLSSKLNKKSPAKHVFNQCML